jgi:hypothetical protein
MSLLSFNFCILLLSMVELSPTVFEVRRLAEMIRIPVGLFVLSSHEAKPWLPVQPHEAKNGSRT